MKRGVDLDRLAARLESRASLSTIMAEIHVARIRANLVRVDNAVSAQFWLRLQAAIAKAVLRSGQVNAELLSEALDASVLFSGVDPNVALFARARSVELAGVVADDVLAAVTQVIDAGQRYGLTWMEQSRLIRDVVGLPPNWVNAPLNLRAEILAGDTAALGRRLSASDAAQIRSRITAGTNDADFANRMASRYADSLTNLRAQTIARTESLRAAHVGQGESWKQAVKTGDLPSTVRRFWIVTLLEGLCEICAAIPGMNPDGRELDEPFDAPDGPVDSPPDPHPNCKCGVGLLMTSGAVL